MDQALYDPWSSNSAPTGQLQGRSSAYSARAAVATRLPDSSDDSEPRRRGGSPGDMVHDRAYDGRRSSYLNDSLDSLTQHDEQRPLCTPAEEGNARMATFYERVSAAHIAIDHFKQLFDQTRALSERLRVLHPNDLDTPFLALELRDHLKAASHYLVDLDSTIHSIYETERETRVFVKLGRVVLDDEELWESKEEVDELLARFLRRVKEIKREARGEKRDRKLEGERKEPHALDDWIACSGMDEVRNLMRKYSVPASRYVATNPFTILSRMLDGMQSLALPALIPKGARPPSTTRRSSKSTRIPSNPTPIGSVSHPMADWKAAIIAESKGRRKHKILDEIAEDLEEGWHEMRYATRRESKERWLIYVVLTLPVLFFCAWMLSSSSDKSGSEMVVKTVPATMMNSDETRSVEVQASSSSSYGNIRARRGYSI